MRRVRTPTRIQMEAVECGAVALAIVLEHYGHVSTVEEMREACGVSRDGVRASRIAHAARQYGMTVEGLQVEMEDLDVLPLPAILHWEFDHFVVLEGLGGDYVYINDPAAGPRRLTRAEVDAAFTGVVLTTQPGPAFRRTPPRANLLSVAAERLRSVSPALVVSALASVTLLFPNLLVPAFSGVFTDQILIRKHTDWLIPLLATMTVVAIMCGWMTWQREQYLLRAQTKLAAGGSLNYLWHALTLPVSFYYQRFAAEIANRATINDAIAGTLAHSVAGLALGLISMLVYAIIMLSYDVTLTLLALGFAGLSVLSLYVSQRLLSDTHRRELMEQSKLAAIVNRSLTGLAESTAAGTNDLVFGRMVGQHGAVMTRRQASQRNTFILQGLQRCLSTLALVAVLIYGGYDIMAGIITVGMMMSFQGLMNLLSAPITQLVSAGASLQDVRGNIERLDDVVRHPRDAAFEVEAAEKVNPKPMLGDIEFRAVTFGYSRDAPALIDGLNLRIAAGTSVAIVGASGCGKSSLTRMLVGQLQPWSGDILIGGESVFRVPRARRFKSFAHVDQEVLLLSGTLQENVTLWDANVEPRTVTRALRDTGLEEVVAKRPGGLSSQVLEQGRNLSGGERQRVDIARAVAMETSILILDEATSALEPPLERRILESLIARKKTLILASHRTAPLALFDRIIVMDNGRIVQDGTPTILAAAPGPFRALMEG